MRKFFLTALLGLSLGFSLNLSAQKAETPKFIGNVEIDFGLCRRFQQKINFLQLIISPMQKCVGFFGLLIRFNKEISYSFSLASASISMLNLAKAAFVLPISMALSNSTSASFFNPKT